MGQLKRGVTGWCAACVLVSAFLLFQVQPMVSKMILPWFGGSPAVWTTCMLFFQVFLLLGYLYAHLLDQLPTTRVQGVVHVVLLVAAVLVLPIVPEAAWKPADSSRPEWRILLLLTANVGLPYLMLAASAPLLQAWYSRAMEGRMPYRFYALSNFGSLAALLSYPFWIEPRLDIPAQGTFWSSGFTAYALLCGGLAVAMARWNLPHSTTTETAQTKPQRISWERLLLWLLLPAFGSMGLLAVTNQICQDVAVVPFLWIAPLSVYLITFILCFDSDLWYRRVPFALLAMASVLAIAAVAFNSNLQPILNQYVFDPLQSKRHEIPDFMDDVTIEAELFLAALFGVCMICHGELVRSKPGPRHLTLFYLCIAAGGALGGMFVALLCPRLFSNYVEVGIFLIGGGLLSLIIMLDSWRKREQRWGVWWMALVALVPATFRLWRGRKSDDHALRRSRWIKLARYVGTERKWYSLWSILVPVPVLATLVLLWWVAEWPNNENELVARRSFYGVLHVTEDDVDTDDVHRSLLNGRILHGVQLIAPGRRREPTTYYAKDSGVGLAITSLRGGLESIRVATVGLGTGTIASYSEAGDYYCFYEINPDVIDIAHEYFTFLGDSPGTVEVIEGDARLSMERQEPQHYDLIALDAFSSDAIPAHLLTVEAFATYLHHLNPNGVLAVHTSNRHLDLVPIVALLADHYQLQAVGIDGEDWGGVADSSSEWILLTKSDEFLRRPDIDSVCYTIDKPGPEIRVWTDHYSNLFQIMIAWQKEEAADEGSGDESSEEDWYEDE